MDAFHYEPHGHACDVRGSQQGRVDKGIRTLHLCEGRKYFYINPVRLPIRLLLCACCQSDACQAATVRYHNPLRVISNSCQNVCVKQMCWCTGLFFACTSKHSCSLTSLRWKHRKHGGRSYLPLPVVAFPFFNNDVRIWYVHTLIALNSGLCVRLGARMCVYSFTFFMFVQWERKRAAQKSCLLIYTFSILFYILCIKCCLN